MALFIVVVILAVFALGFAHPVWWVAAVLLGYALVPHRRGRWHGRREGRWDYEDYDEYRDDRDRVDRWSRRYGRQRRARWDREDRRDRGQDRYRDRSG
ncbi:hypothetical protein [Streptomyces sp. PvR034]|uniref:hypothetical protein n=1 Tax=Streptomyces sp. PvR034 TaxID=3156401 RepID=UPI003391C648